MSDIVKGIITSRNTIVEETQCLSNNNINRISSYQEKTILTLDDGNQYATDLKVNAQCGDKIILLVNNKTRHVETILDKHNHDFYRIEKSEKPNPVFFGFLYSIMNFGLMTYMCLENMSISDFLITSITSSIFVGFLTGVMVNKFNRKRDREEKNLNIEMDLKDFFENPQRCECVIKKTR